MKRTGSPKRGAAKAAKAAKQAAAAARLGVVTKIEIDDHPIIGRAFADGWRDLATVVRKYLGVYAAEELPGRRELARLERKC